MSYFIGCHRYIANNYNMEEWTLNDGQMVLFNQNDLNWIGLIGMDALLMTLKRVDYMRQRNADT